MKLALTKHFRVHRRTLKPGKPQHVLYHALSGYIVFASKKWVDRLERLKRAGGARRSGLKKAAASDELIDILPASAK